MFLRCKFRAKINFVLFLFTIFTVLSIYSYFSIQEKIKDNVYKKLATTNKLTETRIKFWYENLKSHLISLENSTIFWLLFDEYNLRKLNTQKRLTEFLLLLFQEFSLIEGVIYSENFQKIFSLGEAYVNFNNEKTIQRLKLSEKKFFIIEFEYDYPRKLPVTTVYYYLNKNGGKYYFKLKFNSHNSLFKVIEETYLNEHFLETIIFTHNNDTLIYLTDSRFIGQTAFLLKEKTDLIRKNEKIHKRAGEFYLETKDYRGKPVIAVLGFMPEFNFYIMTKIDKEIQTNEIRKIYFGIFGTVLLISFLFSFLMLNILRKEKEAIEIQVNELIKAQEILKQKYKYVMQNANDAVLISDLNDLIIDFNNKAFEYYKFEHENLGSISIKDLYPDELKDYWKEKLEEIKKGQGLVFEAVHKKLNGELFNVQISAKIIKIENYDFVLQIIRDFDERKRMEEELTYAKIKAEESDKLKSNFLSMMSHEVRTPINLILGSVDVLKSRIPAEIYRENEAIFDMILRNSKRLLTLINDIIDISRIESNELKFDFTIRNAESLILDIINEHQDEAAKKSLQIIKNFTATNPYIRLDEIRFYQIINNLLSNAIKFTYHGGITVSTKNVENALHISIKDTGIGIPKDKLAEIFKIFRQAEEGYAREFEGAGLGLTITEKLVKMMGGEIKVESEVGVGSVFTVVFPTVGIVEIDERLLSQLKDIDDNSFKPLIVLIDNNKDEAFYLESLMTRLGVDFVVIQDGRKLFGIIKHKNVDLVIYSINLMNEEEAKSVISDLRENLKIESLKVLAIRSSNIISDGFRLKNLGFNSVIEKPFSFEDLAREIYKLVSSTK